MTQSHRRKQLHGIAGSWLRATMLLAEVHALLGLGHSAMAYAEVMRTYFLGAVAGVGSRVRPCRACTRRVRRLASLPERPSR
jgi:hypothetical protein